MLSSRFPFSRIRCRPAVKGTGCNSNQQLKNGFVVEVRVGGWTFKTLATRQSHQESHPLGWFAAGRRLSSRSQWQKKQGFVKQKSLVVLAAVGLLMVVVGRLGCLGRRGERWSGCRKGGKHVHCQSCK